MESADDDISIRVASFSCYLDTAKENLIHRVSAQEHPNLLSPVKSKPPITKPPLNNNFSYSKDNKDSSLTNLRVDSFSYLKSNGNNFIFNVPGTVQDPTFSFPAHTPKDGELSVFGADKYFNMKLDYPTRQGKLKSLEYRNERPVNLVSVGSSIAPRTPSMSSEASSLNSQTALLRGNGSQTKHQKKSFPRGILAGFGCQGPCFNKKGVQTLVVPGAYNTSNPNRTALTSIPSHGKENFTIKKQKEVPNANDTFEESRNAIEVFGSNASSKGNVATNMERKLSMLTWDAIPKGPTSVSSTICDDMASDASSDLFEIENISGSIYPISTTEAADDMSSCMSPTSHYAPSEASIQWSVITASAADYSDYNDESSVSVAGDILSRNNNAMTSKNVKKRVVGAKEVQKSTPGGLLGCKSHKAVDVAENASHKSGEKAKHHQAVDNLTVAIGKSQGGRGRVKDIDTLQLQR